MEVNLNPVLEQDFCRELSARMPPAAGRKLTVDILPSTWAFQPWLAQLDVSLSGITITAQEKSVNHSFRVVQRQDLCQYDGSDRWVVDKDMAVQGLELWQSIIANHCQPAQCNTSFGPQL